MNPGTRIRSLARAPRSLRPLFFPFGRGRAYVPKPSAEHFTDFRKPSRQLEIGGFVNEIQFSACSHQQFDQLRFGDCARDRGFPKRRRERICFVNQFKQIEQVRLDCLSERIAERFFELDKARHRRKQEAVCFYRNDRLEFV